MAVTVPPALAESLQEFLGEDGRAWAAGLPALAGELLDRWELRPDGPVAHGVIGLVLPVRRTDGAPAVLKLQPVDEETVGEPVALRAWGGRGAVRLLDHEPASGAMLLERLDASRSLLDLPDDLAALRVLADLLRELTQHQAPAELRTLADVADGLLARAPAAGAALADEDERRLLADCAAALREARAEPGDRLLHWDLHYGNVLAPLPGGDRGPWLAIDPKPLAGHPGFELLPALRNRWTDVLAAGDPARALRRRFDLLVEALELEREVAAAWTLGRVLQNAVWGTEEGETVLDPAQRAIAELLSGQRGRG
ncbi:aminoglycoside phosphotransferase family protein [Kitasatospora sp. SUK 42]|uniref:aminoglycoside phosphotransferase family protein n=1 Tax=Kitasatospora sp. SUK 42 TaxID=1588882 RepID=UPI0018CAD13F|nr:aminoglycoside phosphotransferase family protein [Kitasatospora sp. SUK 42]MBV2156001.1 aminoglycoside phosphotransferase family protein [Kitasatospora sp. SUK 42]